MNTWPDCLEVKTAIPPRHDGELADHEGEVLGLTLAAHLERNVITYGTIPFLF